MTVSQFCAAVIELRSEFPFSVTSWYRTPRRNLQVGGVFKSQHIHGLAVDIVLDEPNISFSRRCNELGLVALEEGDHVHVQAPHVTSERRS